MKKKIKRLADGGGFAAFTPIIHSAPTPQISQPAKQTGSTEPESNSIIDEKMLEYLYKNRGLVNDVNKLVSDLIKLESSSTTPYLNKQNRIAALQITARINEVSQNKESWNDAIKIAKEAGGLSEIAVDTYGRIFSKTPDNQIKSYSLEEYKTKKDKIRPLSVQELMYERQYNPNLTGKNEVFTVAENAIGINNITDHIKNIVTSLAIESDESEKFYEKEKVINYLQSKNIKNPTKQEIEGLVVLNEIANSPGDYVSVNKKITSQRGNIEKALGYIWSTLGTPAQQKLRAVSITNNIDNPLQLIYDMLNVHTDHSESLSITPKTLPKSKEESKNSDKSISLSVPELFHGDRLHTPGMFYEINNPSAKVSLKVTATGIGSLFSLTKNGEILGPETLNRVLISDNYQSILNQEKVYLGDEKVDPMLLRELAYTGQQVAKVYMPVRADGSPDLGQMEKFNTIFQEFSKNKNSWTKEQAEKYFKQNGFSNVIIKQISNQDGTVDKVIAESGNVRPFLAIPVITSSSSDLSDNPWMTKIIGPGLDAAELLLEEAFTVYGGTPSKPTKKLQIPHSTFGGKDPYQGVAFIAYRPEANAILSATQRHLIGTAPTDEDLYRNLNFSTASQNPSGINSSSDVLKDN